MIQTELHNCLGAVVCWALSRDQLAFGQIKNSLSSTSLSGNWVIEIDDVSAIESICRSHVLISNDLVFQKLKNSGAGNINRGDLHDFLSRSTQVQSEVDQQWRQHLVANPKKVNSLVAPNWPNWLEGIDLSLPIETLTRNGKSPHPDNTPEDMKDLIATARVVKSVLDNWRDIEEQRYSKKFLEISKLEIRLWPPGWGA